jgi:hypothetical protein
VTNRWRILYSLIRYVDCACDRRTTTVYSRSRLDSCLFLARNKPHQYRITQKTNYNTTRQRQLICDNQLEYFVHWERRPVIPSHSISRCGEMRTIMALILIPHGLVTESHDSQSPNPKIQAASNPPSLNSLPRLLPHLRLRLRLRLHRHPRPRQAT